MITRIRVLDFESSSESPETGGLVEIAYTDVVANGIDIAGAPYDWEVVEGSCRRANPGGPIPPETSAIHHIVDADVATEPGWIGLLANLIRRGKADGVIAYAAHSVAFEALWIDPAWMGPEPVPMICTYKSSLRLWTDAPLHSNMGLFYHRWPVGIDRAKAQPAHSAGPDSYVTAFHLRDMLNDGAPIEQLVEWTKLPALTLRCKMAKYRNGGKGTPWEEVDDGLMQWIINKPDMDEDTVYTVRHHLALREESRRASEERRDINAQLRANGLPEEPVAADPHHNPLVGAASSEDAPELPL